MMQAGFLFFVCRALHNYKKTKGKNGTFIKNGKNVQNRWKNIQKKENEAV